MLIFAMTPLFPLGVESKSETQGPGQQLFYFLSELVSLYPLKAVILSKSTRTLSYKVKTKDFLNIKIGSRFLPIFFLKYSIESIRVFVRIRKRVKKRIIVIYVTPVSWVVIPALMMKKIFHVPVIVKVGNPSLLHVMSAEYEKYEKNQKIQLSKKKRISRTIFLLIKKSLARLTIYTSRIQIVNTNQRHNLLYLGAQENKIIYIPNGIKFPKKINFDRKKTDKKFFLYIGRLENTKGIQILIPAFIQILDWIHSEEKLELKIIGRGSLTEETLLKDIPKNKHKSIEFLGSQAHDVVLSHINDCFAVILPSFGEGISNVILESLSLAKPVITTATVGNIDIIIHKQNGLLCRSGDSKDLANKMMILIENPNLAKKFGIQGRETVKRQFNIQQTTRDIVSVIKDLN